MAGALVSAAAGATAGHALRRNSLLVYLGGQALMTTLTSPRVDTTGQTWAAPVADRVTVLGNACVGFV